MNAPIIDEGRIVIVAPWGTRRQITTNRMFAN